MTDLPRAVSTDQEFYAHHSQQLGRVADLLAEQNELLRQVLTDRQAGQPHAAEAPTEPGTPVAVELREPDPPRTTTSTSPELTTGENEPEPDETKKSTRTARGGRRSTKAST